MLTIRQLSAQTGIPSATLGGYFSGRHLPQVTDLKSYGKLLSALGVEQQAMGVWVETLRRLRSTTARPTLSDPPFRGLVPFDIDDADWFFGREDTTSRILERIRSVGSGGPKFLALIGASGSGKSSLLRAGVLADLLAQGHQVAITQPGEKPSAALHEALNTGVSPQYLAIDQFEELFDARISEDERDEVITALFDLANRESSPFILIAVRADFYEQCVSDPRLLELLRTQQELVGAMTEEELRRAVTEPAARAGVKVQPEFVTALLNDLTPRSRRRDSYEPGLLPLFSHALLSVWERSNGTALQLTDYVALGGIAEAIQRTAEGVYENLSENQQASIQRVFAQLVTINDEGVATRRRISHADLTASEDTTIDAIEAFVRNRILVATESTLDISHEALLFAWPRLAEWIDADRGSIRVQRRVSDAADAWDEHGRQDGALLRGPLLELAAPYANDDQRPMRELDRTFLAASTRRSDEEAAAKRSGERRLRGLLVTSLVFAVAAALVSAFLVVAVHSANHEREVAQTQKLQAMSRQVAIESHDLRTSDPGLSEQLALVAYQLSPTFEARSALLEASGETPVTRVSGPEGLVKVSVNPEGNLLATASADGSLRTYALAAGHAPRLRSVTAVSKAALMSGTFSPDGNDFAVGDMAGGVTLLNVSADKPFVIARKALGANAGVEAVTFSRDGRYLYAATGAPSLVRWNVGSSSLTDEVVARGFGGTVQSVAVSRSGELATGSDDGVVRLWTSDQRRIKQVGAMPVGDATNFVYSVAFSPDGRQLAAASKDKTVRVWSMGEHPQLLQRLGGFSSWVNDVAYSPDGATLAAVGSNGISRTWRTTDWQLIASVPGPTNFTSAQLTDSDLVTGSIDGITRMWPIAGPRLPGNGSSIWSLAEPADGSPLYLGFGPPTPQVSAVDESNRLQPRGSGALIVGPGGPTLDGVNAVSPNGDVLIAGTATGELVVFPGVYSENHQPGRVIHAATALIENVAFSPDGKLLATASDDGTVTLFSVTGDQLTFVRRWNVNAVVVGLSFSPDGRTIAAGDANSLVHLFNTGSGALLSVLKGFTNYVNALAFSPDGHVLAGAGSDRTTRLWNVADPTHPHSIGSPLTGPADVVYALAWTGGGSVVAAASEDGKIWMWTVDKNGAHPYANLGNLGGGVTQLLARPGSDVLFGAGADGLADSWETNTETVAHAICSSAGSLLTESEWSQYVPGIPYRSPC